MLSSNKFLSCNYVICKLRKEKLSISLTIIMIKNNLKNYRIYKGLTQDELASILNISRTYLSKIESNMYCPRPKLMEEICLYFDVKLYQMFYIENKD